MTAGPGPAEILMIVGLVISTLFPGMPMSVPPLPPDPIVSRAVPDECLMYVSLAGRAVPDGSSGNKTEQLLTEPEVQKFVSEVGEEIRKAIGQQLIGGAVRDVLREELPSLLRMLASHPLSFYVSKAEMSAEGPDIRAALIVNTGDEAASCEAAIKKIQATLLEGASPEMKPESIDVGGIQLTRVPMPPGAPEVVWGFRKQFLILAIGQDSAKDLLALLKDRNRKAPEWLATIKKHLPIERTSAMYYVNVAKSLAAVGSSMGDPKTQAIVTALGLDKVNSVANVTGMTAEGMSSRTWIQFDGEPKGLLAIGAGKGISTEDVRAIPADATMAYMLRLDLADVYRQVLDATAAASPPARAAMDQQIQGMEQGLAFKLEDDILKPLGDLWTIYGVQSGMGAPAEAALTVSLDDRATFSATHDKLLNMARMILGQGPVKLNIQESDHGGNKVYTIESAMLPIAPSWCVSNDRLILTPSLDAMKMVLSPAGGSTLADVPEVQQSLSGSPPTVFRFFNTVTAVNTAKTLEPLIGETLQKKFAEQGADIKLPVLPSLDAVAPHLGPAVSVLRPTDGGLLWEVTYTFPMFSGGDVTTVGVLGGLMLPAVQAAREAARRVSAAN